MSSEISLSLSLSLSIYLSISISISLGNKFLEKPQDRKVNLIRQLSQG